MNNPQEKQQEFFSLAVLSDILSLPKRSIESRVKKGEIVPCEKSGLIDKAQVLHLPAVRSLHESQWESELNTKPKRKYNLVELFAGGGGLALGMEQAGFESVLLNEMDKHACNTLKHNRPDWNVIQGDISDIDFTTIREEVDVLTGGFPCQAFSYAGKSLGFEDTRGTLFYQMARAIKETKPKIFMAENVRALLTHDNGRTLETIKKVIEEIGYTLIVEPKVIKAIFYKVPQKRERLILVGVRNDLVNKADFKWPSPYKRVMTLNDAFYKGELFDTDVSSRQVKITRKEKLKLWRKFHKADIGEI
jgi:DNA (cytosine-5)-methyltransferase 1